MAQQAGAGLVGDAIVNKKYYIYGRSVPVLSCQATGMIWLSAAGTVSLCRAVIRASPLAGHHLTP